MDEGKAKSSKADILIVDDKINNLRLLANILAKQGYTARPAKDGKIALVSAKSRPPDLILLDIMMPELDGYEVCRQLKQDEQTKNIPIIFISALNEVFDKVQAFELGGVDYITKPFHEDEVLARVKIHLSLINAHKKLKEKNLLLNKEVKQRRQAEKELRRQNKYLAALHETSFDLISCLDINELLQNILNRAVSLTSVSDGFIYLYNHEIKLLEMKFGLGSFAKKTGFILEPGKGLAGKVFQTGQSILISNYRTWSGRLMGPGFRDICSIAGIPLEFENCIQGVIGLAHTSHEKKIGKHEAEILEYFSKLASIALNNAHLYTKMKQEIYERRLTEDQLYKAREAAETANRAKSEFLACMSHDIRTPMNAILGFSQILLESIKDFKQKTYLKNIYTSGKLLLSLINDILDLSKIESGKLELQKEPIEINNIFNEIKVSFDSLFKKKRVKLITSIDKSVSKGLILDELRIRQILNNLVSNAIKFTSHGYVSLTAKGTNPKTDTIDLIFEVQDTGLGIAKEQQHIIFESFQQQKRQKTKDYGGTGLGLTITKKLTEMMQGEISLESEINKGSLFKIKIPEVQISSENNLFNHCDDLEYHIDVKFVSSTILMVDDIYLNRMLVKVWLQDSNINLIEAENGEHALNLLKTGYLGANQNLVDIKPDLILMDLKMPGRDGYEVTEIIRQDNELKNIPIIALSALIINDDDEKKIKSLFDGYLLQPVTKARLVSELKNFLVCKPLDCDLKQNNQILKSDIAEKKPDLENNLAEVLQDIIIPEWEKIKDMFFIDDVADFALKIRHVSLELNNNILSEYSRDLYECAQTNNIDKMENLIEQFPQIIDKI